MLGEGEEEVKLAKVEGDEEVKLAKAEGGDGASACPPSLGDEDGDVFEIAKVAPPPPPSPSPSAVEEGLEIPVFLNERVRAAALLRDTLPWPALCTAQEERQTRLIQPVGSEATSERAGAEGDSRLSSCEGGWGRKIGR